MSKQCGWKSESFGKAGVLLMLLAVVILPIHTAAAQGAYPCLSLEAAELVAACDADAGSPGVDRQPYVFFSQDTVTVVPEPDYEATPRERAFFGEGYRDVWTMPLAFPVIDLERTAGGLTPLRLGGGMQTTTLHLKGEDDHFYVLRSVDKSAERSLPEGVRETFIHDIAQDQLSSLNPVGAVVVPALAEAAGVLHTCPTLVVIPDSPRLGEYRDAFAGMLVLFERKPDEDQSAAARFGYSENVVGTAKLFEELREDNDERVDERAYARARLFDMLIGDWDRGHPQWRWAEFDDEHGTRYVAVPRDRDYVFARFDGTMLRLGKRTGSMLLRRFTNFDGPIEDLMGINWQGAGLDHRLTASLSREEWNAIADSLQAALTDKGIETAIRAWPPAVFEEIGPETIRILKTRRDQLPEVAEAYYELLADVVDIVGSDKHERFEVQRLGNGTAQVTMYKTEDDGEVERALYHRTFYPGETREVRLYGLGGLDRYVVEGEAADKLVIRLLGGQGEDTYTIPEAAADGVHLYDTAADTDLDIAPGVELHISNQLPASRYQLRPFSIPTALAPTAAFDYDSDDGILVGGGLTVTRNAFRKEPHAARHTLSLSYAPRSEALVPRYEGHAVDLWQGGDVRVSIEAVLAGNYRSFYGLGNETSAANRSRFMARLRTVTAVTALRYAFGKASALEVGPRFVFIDADPPGGLSADDPRVAYTPDQLERASFAGLQTRLWVDTRDTSRTQAQLGLVLTAETQVNLGVGDTEERFGRLTGEARLYQALHPAVPLTLALRVGGATKVGDFTFYQASTLGGNATLRGYPRTRFAGRSAAYANAELRARLFDLNVYVVRGEVGVLGFFDTGRVWADGETSGVWHQGYGGGLWFRPFGFITLVGSLGFSDEGHVFDLSSRFFF